MKFSSRIFLLLFLLPPVTVRAQKIIYARNVIDTLCSPFFAGRGYSDDGEKKAAAYIQQQYEHIGLKAFDPGYSQGFGFSVNIFPNDPEVKIDNISIQPGSDFLVDPSSRSIAGTFELRWVDSATIDDPKLFKEFEENTHFRRCFLVLDRLDKAQVKRKEALKKIVSNDYKAAGIVEVVDKLMWSIGYKQETIKLQVRKGAVNRFSKHISVDIFCQVNSNQAQNIIGFVRGNERPDSFIVFTAHYDHLGKMGKSVYFPGANDNASGVAMMLDLASYYATTPERPKYSVAFMAFAGEEAGLLGSFYYTEHPMFPLKSIKFLVNLDLMGTGGKGMTVVNATEFPEFYNKLEIANTIGSYLPVINQRGKAQNSDHYYFTEAGVPSFFFYLMGDYAWYHDPGDKAENLPLDKYDDTFKLIRDFVKEIEY